MTKLQVREKRGNNAITTSASGTPIPISDYDRRKELADFLKRKRDSLSPEVFGFPMSKRRRTQGLLREEVAIVAGLGLTWYTWLEQGREIQVSSSFLELLAAGLRLNPTERSYLFNLAQLRPPPFPADDGESTFDEIQDILDVISVPAYARNRYFDVIAWNNANTLYFGDFAATPIEERNVAWLMFTREQYRRNMPNWESDARALVATLRLSFSEAGHSAAFSRLVGGLSVRSADFKRIWDEHDVSYGGEGVSKIMSRARTAVNFHSYTLTPERFPSVRLALFDPQIRNPLLSNTV
ncbi:helix-turn-helix transcriptional regulator [Rhizobium miluonense]|jgi:transcriptional regulator with XRE-family HTH domain|uniref:Transcriptional regulator with XRE-family HTH domain n=1 Tax=Rhizobium miluonense TaxID=411945 RepID=A0ABU1SXA0_9HYPH|nr:helix-turn-helix transcriptional regulator [Rhizobium miluonense]MDR6903556.1 transcriptional regulator with XRE-family HTH domain [Rhizobium miluonense]